MAPSMLLALILLGLGVAQAATLDEAPAHVGAAQCKGCHEAEFQAWRGSHHDLAMAEATEQTVLGDFRNQTFVQHGIASRFFRRDGRYFVNTEGPDGTLQDFEIKYTFGWTPLQQYLIDFPGGRLQVLSIAWDSRSKKDGGQRWFHLHPNERIAPHDELFWTRPSQNWNYMCAECHSTGLRKNYRPEEDRYETEWAEIDVACEACHGPGSRHLAWAGKEPRDDADATRGLVVRLPDADGGAWAMDSATGIAKRTVPRTTQAQLETCARCHSRRALLHEPYVHGRPIGDTHRVSLLEDRLYYPDGQIRDEVYEYGSFLQSRMQRAGVICSDCHDPHSLRLKATGNGVCVGCHLATKYDSSSHHHHQSGSPGAACVECHAPTHLYMVVDGRRDHSFRVPRPDLSSTFGTPDACTECHKDKSHAWAAEAIAGWYGPDRRAGPEGMVQALKAGRTGAADAEGQLAALAGDGAQPGIVRATALASLREVATPASLMTLQRAVGDPDPLVRRAAAAFLEWLDPAQRYQLGAPLLSDAVRDVRIEAGFVLAPVPREGLSPEQVLQLDKAIGEYEAAQRANAERPESDLNLGLLHSAVGLPEKAEAAYRSAIRKDPAFVPAYVNLADLLRVQGRSGEAVLREGIAAAPRAAALHHALGLALVREQRPAEAAPELQRAAELAPDNPRFGFVYAVAVKETEGVARALEVLRAQLLRQPENRDLLLALMSYSREAGDMPAARDYAERLARLAPKDPQVQKLRAELEGP
jgi:predicted CXXCH cytochrome family protein